MTKMLYPCASALRTGYDQPVEALTRLAGNCAPYANGRFPKSRLYTADKLFLWRGNTFTRPLNMPPITPLKLAGFYCAEHIVGINESFTPWNGKRPSTLELVLDNPNEYLSLEVNLRLTRDPKYGMIHKWEQVGVDKGRVSDIVPQPIR